MISREIKSEKLFSVIYLFLAIPFVSFASSSMMYDDYYYSYSSFFPVSTDGIYVIAGFFLSLTVKERYLQYAFQLVASIKLVTLILHEILGNSRVDAFPLLALLCGSAALGVSIKIFVDQKINPTIFIKALFGRVRTTQHVIFGRVYVVFAALSALGSGIIALSDYSNDRLTLAIVYKLVNAVAMIFLSLLISEIIYFLINKNWDEIASIKRSLDDTAINSYITRTLSSWSYLVIRHFLLLFAVIAVPYTLSSMGYEWLPFIGGFLLLPLYVLFAYLALMIVRLLFEYTNALIHVAENTRK